MKGRIFFALVCAYAAAPLQAFQLWTFLTSVDVQRSTSMEPLIVANLVLLGLLCAVAADFSIARRAGRAALLGGGVALLMPGPLILDQLVAFASPDWDVSTWLVVLLPYGVLLGVLGVAEAALYLLATRPRVVS